MKIGFCVNNLLTEHSCYTTTDIAMTATRMGHESWHINVGDFAYDQDEAIHAHACRVARDGYIIAQQHLPEAVHGDTRLFLMNGEILQQKGRVAAIRRVHADGNMRSNITAGAFTERAKINGRMLGLLNLQTDGYGLCF